MHSQTTPHVVNNGLIDFQDTGAALYHAVCQQQAVQNQAMCQHQALMAAAAGQLAGAGYSAVNAPPNGPSAPYPGPPAYPGYPGGTGGPAYPVYPGGTGGPAYPVAGAVPAYPAATASSGVVTGPPSFIEVNGVKYQQESVGAKSAAPARPAAAGLSEAELERSIKHRVDSRVEEFMSRRGGSLGARAGGARRPASTAEDPLVGELRKLNERMSRVAGSAKSRS